MKNIDYKALIKSLNLNQQEFADSIGVSLRSVSNWVKGEFQPTTSVYRKIVQLYGNKIEELKIDPIEKIETILSDKEVYFEIDGNNISGDKIALTVVKNKEYFKDHAVVNAMIEETISKRIAKITRSEENFKKWLNG